MTENKTKKLSGIVPLPPREVSAVPYFVQPGDTVERITGRFTHPSRWPGLVGANVLRKELADAEGERYACFAELEVGEPLLIPAAWAGNVGWRTTSITGAFPRIRLKKPKVSVQATPTHLNVSVPSAWDQRLDQTQYTNIAYWSQRIEAIIRNKLNWFRPDYKHCGQAFDNNTSKTRSALIEWLRSFSSPDAFAQAMGPGISGVYPALIPIDLWFAKEPSHRYLATRGAANFMDAVCWDIPTTGSGSVGALPISSELSAIPELTGTLSIVDPIVSFFSANWPKILKAIQQFAEDDTWQVPVGPTGQQYSSEDIARVIAGFIPYLAKMPAGSIPATITTQPPLSADPSTWGDMIPALAKSASELLGVAQVAGGSVLQTVPWDEVPWHSFPWSATNSFSNCWSFLQGSLQQQGITMKPQTTQLAVNNTPNLLGDWASGPWSSVPWSEINWSLVDPSIWETPNVQKCLKDSGAAERLKEMMNHQQCFIGKGPTVFAKYLCKKADGTYEDLALCDQAEVLPAGCPTGWKEENGVCLPVGDVHTCASGHQAYPAPSLPYGVACCPDGSIYDISTGQCLKPGASSGTTPTQPKAPTTETKTEGLSTFAKLGIGVSAAGTLGLVYALWSNE